MHELAVIAGIDTVGADRDDGARSLGQRAGRLDGAALVPEQTDDHQHDQEQAEDHPADRALDPPEPRNGCHFPK